MGLRGARNIRVSLVASDWSPYSLLAFGEQDGCRGTSEMGLGQVHPAEKPGLVGCYPELSPGMPSIVPRGFDQLSNQHSFVWTAGFVSGYLEEQPGPGYCYVWLATAYLATSFDGCEKNQGLLLYLALFLPKFKVFLWALNS